MKKILLFTLVAVLTLTTVLISACGNIENPGEGGLSSSIEEVVSSSVRPSRGSINHDELASSTPSYEDPNGSMSYTDPNIVSGSNAGGVYVEGDPFTVNSADPSGASVNASTVIGYINMIGTVDGSNYVQRGQYIEYARQKYDALTASEKAEVINYSSLVGAEQAFASFNHKGTLIIFDNLYATLKDPEQLKNADVPLVYELRDMMNANPNFSTEIENFSTKQAKINACYQKIQSSIVEMTYIAQDGNGNGLLESSVTTSGGKTVSELTSPKKRGNDFNKVSNVFNIVDDVSSGSEDAYHMYSDTKNTNVKIWQYTNVENTSPITFTAPTPGTLTIYVRPQNERTYVVSYGDGESNSFYSGDDEASCKFELDVSGQISITTSQSKGYLIALKFSYPNLG